MHAGPEIRGDPVKVVGRQRPAVARVELAALVAAGLLPVRVLAKLFRRLFLARLVELHGSGGLRFFGDQLGLADRRAFLRYLAPIRKKSWEVYAKPPFAGPEAVLAYLSRTASPCRTAA